MKNKIIKLVTSTTGLLIPTMAMTGCSNSKIIVKFDTQGGSAIADQEVNSEGLVTKPNDPTKEGYKFRGWYNNAACSGIEFNFNLKIEKSLTLYAKWERPGTFNVIFDTQGGSTIDPQEVVEDGKAVRPHNDPTKEDYKFGDWYDNKECEGQPFDFNTKITKSIVLYASWEELEDVTVTFDSDGGTEVEPITVKEGKTITKPTNPTKKDCEFVTWVDEDENPFDFSTPITSDITLYATWQIAETMEVTFNTKGGSAIQSQHVKTGGYATKPTDPTLKDMKFVDWYEKEDYSGEPFDFENTPITGSITLYAKWRQTVTELKIKGTIPNVEVGETTTWKIEDYIEVVPATAPIQDLELVLTITDKDYIQDVNHQLKIVSIPEDQPSYSIKVRSVDNPSVYTYMTIPYTQITTADNLEICIANDNGTFGVRAKDKSTIGESVYIPANTTYATKTYYIGSIADRGFSGCTNLKKLTFAANNKFTTIGTSAFANCPNLSDIQLLDNITWIGNKAFLIDDASAVPTLKNITLPSSLTLIDENAFTGQTALESITIPKTVTKIAASAFYKCTGLKSVTIPDDSALTFIGNLAFAGCTALESISKFPKTFVKDVDHSTTTGLGNGVFAKCTNLATIEVDEDNPTYKVFEDVGHGMALAAWYTLDGTTYHELVCYPKATGEITISDDWDLNSICSGCFAGTTITKLHLPNTLLRMKYAAFEQCTTLKQLFLGEHYNEWKWDGATAKPPFLSDEQEALRSVNVNIVQSAESSYYSLIRY